MIKPVITHRSQDIDYGARNYYVETKQGPKGSHAWQWANVEFRDAIEPRRMAVREIEAATYDAGGVMIIDARGQLSNGKRWQCLGKFGESASYSNMNEATAKILDQFLDGACLKSAPHRYRAPGLLHAEAGTRAAAPLPAPLSPLAKSIPPRAPDTFLDEAEHCTAQSKCQRRHAEMVRDHPGIPFGFPPE